MLGPTVWVPGGFLCHPEHKLLSQFTDPFLHCGMTGTTAYSGCRVPVRVRLPVTRAAASIRVDGSVRAVSLSPGG